MNVATNSQTERLLSEQLGFLVGRFSGPEIMHETTWAPAARAVGRAVGRLTSFALIHEQVQEQSGAATFSALNVFALDRVTGQVVMYSFDSAGFLPDPPARGSWVDGELVLARSTDRGQSRTRYSRTDRGYRWHKEYRPSDDTEWATVVEGHMHAEA